MIINKLHHKGRKAQAATEVAVLGAVIIFLIGMIIRTTISSQYAQNQNFKAMRLALAKSLESAKAGKTERNSASVLYIEDRLVPEFNKYGSLERTPFMAQGSGTMSHLLMYPIDEQDVNNSIPKLDIFINGQYFPFTTAALRPKLIVPASVREGYNPIKNQLKYVEPGKHSPVYQQGIDTYLNEYSTSWHFQCKCEKQPLDAQGNSTCYACPVFFQIIPKGDPEFCTDYTDNDVLVDVGCTGLFNWQRFDLNRNGSGADDPKPFSGDRSAVPRDKIAWQWFASQAVIGDDKKPGIEAAIKPDIAQYLIADVDNDRKEETVYGYNRINLDDWTITNVEGVSTIQKQDMNNDIQAQVRSIVNPTYSSDGQLLRPGYPGGEQALRNDFKLLRSKGIVTDVMVLDNQDGDIDLTHDSSSPGSQRGLQPETAIYTRMRQEPGTTRDKGTYFLVKEGKLYNPESGNYVRSVNKRDQVDLVERHVLLSNNTQRFCRPNNVRPQCIGELVTKDGKCEVAENPVEVCTSGTGDTEFGGCFSPLNVAKTCLDTGSNMLYVRSRIVNRGGHKWITDATDRRPEINIR